MTVLELTQVLACYTRSEISLREVRQALSAFKDSGGHRDRAEQAVKDLEALSPGYEPMQDRIYEILDIVTGWCSPFYRVWD